MKAITINGYRYGYWTRELIYSRRDDAYYRNSTDPLTKKLYAALKNEERNFESPFFGMSANQLLDDIFFVCTCLYEDDDLEIDLDKHLGWISMRYNQIYTDSHLSDDLAEYHCNVYACVLAVLGVQKTLPEKVQHFISAVQQKIIRQTLLLANDFMNAREIALDALLPQSPYTTNLRPNVNLIGVKHIKNRDVDPDDLKLFLTNEGIRMVLSRIHNTNDCIKAINFLLPVQRISATIDLNQSCEIFFAKLREECKRNGKIEKVPTQEEPDEQQATLEQEQITQLQQQIAEKDDIIAQLKKEVESLKNIDDKPTVRTTINNFNGNVGQVANNVEEQHITEKQ